jgi:hypothetical protein
MVPRRASSWGHSRSSKDAPQFFTRRKGSRVRGGSALPEGNPQHTTATRKNNGAREMAARWPPPREDRRCLRCLRAARPWDPLAGTDALFAADRSGDVIAGCDSYAKRGTEVSPVLGAFKNDPFPVATIGREPRHCRSKVPRHTDGGRAGRAEKRVSWTATPEGNGPKVKKERSSAPLPSVSLNASR